MSRPFDEEEAALIRSGAFILPRDKNDPTKSKIYLTKCKIGVNMCL